MIVDRWYWRYVGCCRIIFRKVRLRCGVWFEINIIILRRIGRRRKIIIGERRLRRLMRMMRVGRQRRLCSSGRIDFVCGTCGRRGKRDVRGFRRRFRGRGFDRRCRTCVERCRGNGRRFGVVKGSKSGGGIRLQLVVTLLGLLFALAFEFENVAVVSDGTILG
jgi:hypothetical protein